MDEKTLHSWRDWYTFARENLALEAQEATEYANLRYAEESNRRTGHGPQPDLLRADSADD